MREELELSGPADRVDIWNDDCDTLCPDRLWRLFTAGLTSVDIGKLYDLDRRRISQLAQEWGLCSRSLRAAGRSLIELRPDLAREFVADGRCAPTTQARAGGDVLTAVRRGWPSHSNSTGSRLVAAAPAAPAGR